MYNIDDMIARIKLIKKSKKLKNDELSELSGVPIGTLAKILGSETKDPKISSIIKISQALNVSTDFIIFGKDKNKTPPPLTAEENKILEAFSKLNPTGKAEAVNRVEELTEISKYTFSAPSSTKSAM